MRDDVGCIVNMIDDAVTTCEDDFHDVMKRTRFNPLIGTLKPHSNGPLYSNTVIGTLVVDGCCIWYSEEGSGQAGTLPSPILTVPNITAHPSTASVPTSYYLMWRYNCLWTVKG